MLVPAHALGQTLALLATWLGVGVLAGVLVAYIIGQVMAERKQNREPPYGSEG